MKCSYLYIHTAHLISTLAPCSCALNCIFGAGGTLDTCSSASGTELDEKLTRLNTDQWKNWSTIPTLTLSRSITTLTLSLYPHSNTLSLYPHSNSLALSPL